MSSRSKNLLLPLALAALVIVQPGCAWTKRQFAWHHQPAKATAAPAKTIVTPDDSLAAKVVSVNTVGRFVVLNFPDGRMPKIDQHLFLYRGGLKSAEVQVVGPQQDTSIVADIVSGEAQKDDTVRDQ
jgi:hypothetical protein